MSDRIILAWTVDTTGSPYASAGISAAMAAVPLYVNATTDPVLGQLFGLTVVSDVMSTPTTSTAKRTLTLNMTANVAGPKAPPPFPCHPRTSTPPVLPYPLRTKKALPGSFFVTNGSLSVATTATMKPSLNVNDTVEFQSQPGVYYTVTGLTDTTIAITPAFTGRTTNTPAIKEVIAPAVKIAVYSSSDLDTNGAATTPIITAGPGCRSINISYRDSAGNTATVTAYLTGRRPNMVTLDGGTIDVASITAVVVNTFGAFRNSVGQITIAEVSEDVQTIEATMTPEEFPELVDEAQLLIDRHLVYLPPSYFALAGQQSSFPQLEGDFLVTTGSKSVRTAEDQTGSLSAGNTILFASQPGKVYTIASISKKIIGLTETYTGLDLRKYDTVELRGKGGPVIEQPTGAFRITSSPALPPSDIVLAGPLAQFLETMTAQPPDDPPLSPHTVPTPTFLSGFFSRTLSLALAVPVTSSTITFT